MFSKNKNLVAGGFLFIVGLIYFLLSFQIQLTSIDKLVGSRLFPQIIGILIMFFSGWLVIDNLMKNKKSEKAERQITEDGKALTDNKPKSNNKNTFLVLTSLAAYIFLMEKIGFLVSTLIYLISQMALLEKGKENRNYLKYLVVAIISSIAIYVLFTTVFNMVLPRGIFI